MPRRHVSDCRQIGACRHVGRQTWESSPPTGPPGDATGESCSDAQDPVAIVAAKVGNDRQGENEPSRDRSSSPWQAGPPPSPQGVKVVLFRATDFPHPDHPGTWPRALERFVAPLSVETRAKVLGRNVARIYRL
jgi:hypothetical protein